VKSGTGTLRLNAANTYDGGTQVTEGTLELGSSASLGNTSVTVSFGATLGGSETINGATTI
jgi:autotransporter-associated beta strand protein